MRFKVLLLLFLSLFLLYGGIKDKKKELDYTRKRLKKVKKELSRLKKEKKNLLKKLYLLDERERLTEQLIRDLKAEERETYMEILKIENDIDSLYTEINSLKKEIERIIVKYYLYQRIFKRYVIGFQDPSRYLRRLVLLKRISMYDRERMEEFLHLIDLLSIKKENLTENIRYLSSIREEREREADSLRYAKMERRREIKKIEREEEEKKRLYKQLLVAQRRLENLIKRMEKERKRRGAGKERTYVKGKGRLLWPCRGKIVAGYGVVRHPVYGTKINNQGIDIRCSGYVKAVESGEVVFSDDYLGYGNTVIISHGKGYYSVYSHLDIVNVSRGDKVKRGEVIGKCYELLHFEWRVKGKSVNPLRWLR